RKAARRGHADADSGKGAGADRDRDPADVLESEAGGIKRRIDEFHQPLGMAAADIGTGSAEDSVLIEVIERRLATRARRIDRKDDHGGHRRIAGQALHDGFNFLHFRYEMTKKV